MEQKNWGIFWNDRLKHIKLTIVDIWVVYSTYTLTQTLVCIYVRGVKKVRFAIKSCSYYFSYNVSNAINVTVILQSRLTWQDINNRMFNQIICYWINDLQNQVPFRNFWARGSKWGCMTKNHCNAMAIVIRIWPNWLRKPKWSCYSVYMTFRTFTKLLVN